MATLSCPVIDLSGKVALVTGASRGIGLEIARTLAGCGAGVAINDIATGPADMAAMNIAGTMALPGDVTSEADASRMVETVREKFGSLDILVNNAGCGEPVRATLNQDLPTWRGIMDVNLQGPFVMSKAAVGVMGKKGGGTILNIASVAGLCAFPASNAYGVSKAALIMLTKTLACELARFGIRVNAIAPGVIEAPMTNGLESELGQSRDLFERRIPMARLGAPAEIASVVAFLVSDLASYVTGAVLPVDGGWSAFGGLGDASRSVRRKANDDDRQVQAT
ncbi:MAG: SDR family oxidoreductase [Sphingomonadales bacterium]|nr:SDR family oxidoreductase [Sphingomonadales bacterium]